MMEEIKRKRINRILCIFALAFLIVLGKAFKVQVIDKDHLITKSKKQFVRERKVYPKRGNIYDRNGKPLAINIQTYSLFTIPKNLKNKKETLKKLSEIVPHLTEEKLLARISKRKRFTWLGRKVELTKQQVQQIKDLDGVYYEAVPKRIYPNQDILAQTLGFVGIDNVGLSGLEYQFDKSLRGSPKAIKFIIDNKGRPIRHESDVDGTEVEDLHLTINKDLQAVAERALKEAVDKYDALKGGVGVLDAETGEVLAMANYPTFDPNNVRSSKAVNRKLSFVSDPFEPGSTFKIFTIASALENKIARPDTNYYCEGGKLKVEDHVISEAETKKKYEWLSVEDIIKYSSNVGTTKIAFDLTYPKLKKTLVKFGIGQKTGLNLPAESRGIFTEEENVSPLSLSNISFGQGVATTGIQMLAAYGAIANGGVYHSPTLVKGKKPEGRRILSKELANELTGMLIKAVDEGTGSRARIPYFKIAGKTSTAQKSDKNGSYTGHIAGFIGYPVNVNKRFVVYSYIDKPAPGKSYYGNKLAAPVFKKVTQYLLYKNKEFDKLAVKDREKKNGVAFDYVKMKKSATRQYGKGFVPNFVGLDKRSSGKLAKKNKLKAAHKGIGVVTSQTPAAGVKINGKTVVKLIYTPPSYE